MRHGPHHSAQASTNTGSDEEASITSDANVASVTACGLLLNSPDALGSFAPHLPQTGWLTSTGKLCFFAASFRLFTFSGLIHASRLAAMKSVGTFNFAKTFSSGMSP